MRPQGTELGSLHMELRDATREDLPSIRSLVAEVAGEYGFEVEPEGADLDLYGEVDAYFGEGGMLRVLEAQGRVVGVIGVVPHGEGAWELRKMYLQRDLRGAGHGRGLLDAALTFARDQGAARVVLQSSTRLESALRLYERTGFIHVEATTRSDACDVMMELSL